MLFPIDFMEFALPFFLVLAIVYGALELGAPFKNRAAKAIIALVIAAFAASSAEFSAFILQVIPYAAILFIVVFLIGFIKKSFFGGKKEGKGGEKNYGLMIVVIALVLVFLAGQGSTFIEDWLPSGFISTDNFILLVGVILIVAILYIVYKNWSEKPPK